MWSWISFYIQDKSGAFHLEEKKVNLLKFQFNLMCYLCELICVSVSELTEWKFLGISDTWKGVHPSVFSSELSGLIAGQKVCRKYRICIQVYYLSSSVDKEGSYDPCHCLTRPRSHQAPSLALHCSGQSPTKQHFESVVNGILVIALPAFGKD